MGWGGVGWEVEILYRSFKLRNKVNLFFSRATNYIALHNILHCIAWHYIIPYLVCNPIPFTSCSQMSTKFHVNFFCGDRAIFHVKLSFVGKIYRGLIEI